jgi:hypothetical protein
MPIHGYPGGVITANPTAPTSSVATGVWTTEQQLLAISQGNWPGYEYPISRSLRFNSADSAYLNRTPASAGNRKTWTWSGWVKRGALGSAQVLMSSDVGTSNTTWIEFGFDAADTFTITAYTTDSNTTSAVFRDPSAWYHIVVAFDSTQATAANRCKIYINGTQQTLTGAGFTLNADYGINNNQIHGIGYRNWASGVGRYFNGYMTEVNFVDGQALDPSSFGLNDPETGVWSPKRYTGTYGTNGFYVNFSDNSNTTAATLGKDYSGNGNNWTPNNFSVTAGAGNDSMVDTPTSYGTDTGAGGEVRGNYCTWNRLQTSSSITLNNGNLDAIISGGVLIYSAAGTVEVATGKWYYETVVTAGYSTNYPLIGVCDLTQITSAINTSFYSTAGGGDSTGIIARGKTNVYLSNNTSTSDGVTYNYTSDVIMIAFDADLGKVWFGKNGTWNNSSNPATNTGGHTFSTVSGKGYRPYVQCNADTSNAWTSNFGQRAFAYTAPSGFKALCTQNLPTPTIGATSTTQANDYMNVALWTGTGSSQNITGVGFQPGLVWGKMRTSADKHYLFNQLAGVNKFLSSNLSDTETTDATILTSFNADGFTLGTSVDLNRSGGYNYVGWAWNAGGSTVTNTSGTISSQVRANTTSGFSIVTYTGTGSNATVGHGLGVAPAMYIVKRRTGGVGNWGVWHTSLSNTTTAYLLLDSQAAQSTSTSIWGSTAATSTTIGIGTSITTNNSSDTYVAYCFAAVAGYSAFGSYTSNGSTDGPFIYLGFRPEYILIKSSSKATEWLIKDAARDPYNAGVTRIYANQNYAETATGGDIDYLSNGFKIRTNTSEINNDSGSTFIWAAFAEFPFKYALAR